MPLICLQCVIVVFPDQTHLFYAFIFLYFITLHLAFYCKESVMLRREMSIKVICEKVKELRALRG